MVQLGAHDLRRTAARLWKKKGGDPLQMKQMLGHAWILTTDRYLGNGQEIGAAVDNLGSTTPPKDHIPEVVAQHTSRRFRRAESVRNEAVWSVRDLPESHQKSRRMPANFPIDRPAFSVTAMRGEKWREVKRRYNSSLSK
jgi:hypothetical protein